MRPFALIPRFHRKLAASSTGRALRLRRIRGRVSIPICGAAAGTFSRGIRRLPALHGSRAAAHRIDQRGGRYPFRCRVAFHARAVPLSLLSLASRLLLATLAVRSLDGAGPQRRGVALAAPESMKIGQGVSELAFELKNTGEPVPTEASLHPMDAGPFLNADLYRISASVEGRGWTVELPNALAVADFGKARSLKAYVAAGEGSAKTATVTIKAVSESDPTKSVTASIQVTR